MPDVEAHGFEDALLGLSGGFTEAVDAGKILAVGARSACPRARQ